MSNGTPRKNGLWDVVLRIGAGLAAAAVIGLFGMALAQGKMETRVDHIEGDVEANQEAAAQIPVIQRDIEYIKESIQDSAERNDEAHEELERKQDLILQEIRKAR